MILIKIKNGVELPVFTLNYFDSWDGEFKKALKVRGQKEGVSKENSQAYAEAVFSLYEEVCHVEHHLSSCKSPLDASNIYMKFVYDNVKRRMANLRQYDLPNREVLDIHDNVNTDSFGETFYEYTSCEICFERDMMDRIDDESSRAAIIDVSDVYELGWTYISIGLEAFEVLRKYIKNARKQDKKDFEKRYSYYSK